MLSFHGFPPRGNAPERSGTRLVERLRSWSDGRRQEKLRRDAFRTLLTVDDAILADIGIDRGEVERAARAPLAVDARIRRRQVGEV